MARFTLGLEDRGDILREGRFRQLGGEPSQRNRQKSSHGCSRAFETERFLEFHGDPPAYTSNYLLSIASNPSIFRRRT